MVFYLSSCDVLCHSIPHISQYLKQELWSDSSISRNQKLWSDSSISPLPTHGHGECWTVQHSRTVCTYEIISFKYIYTLHVFHWLWTVHNQPEFSIHVDSVSSTFIHFMCFIDYEQFIINLNSRSMPIRASAAVATRGEHFLRPSSS